jgi:DNA-binding MarR family transcriptional regulator
VKISEQLKMDINQTSQLLQKLESKDLIKRVASRTDARVKQVFLTDAGEHILEEMNPVIQAADTEYFSALELRKPVFVNLLHDLVRKSEAS